MDFLILGFSIFLIHTSYALISIPLTRSNIEENAHANVALKANGFHPAGDLSLSTFQYYGRINVGTPGQKFDVAFTTLSPYTYIPAITCTPSCGPKSKHHTFIPSDSSTYKDIGSPSENPFPPYTRVQQGSDVVKLDTTSAINQTIALILDGNCDGLVYDGIFGLAFSPSKKDPSFIDNLYDKQAIPQKVVGFYLNRNKKCKTSCGEITIGGWNNNKVQGSSIRYIQAHSIPEVQWKITLTTILIGSSHVADRRSAALDTASGFIYVPLHDLTFILSAVTDITRINGTVLVVNEYLVKNLPSLTFNIGGADYTLNGYDYVDTVNRYNGNPRVLLMENDPSRTGVASDHWVLGNAFLGKYYTILDYDSRKVAFATINGASSLTSVSSVAVSLSVVVSLICKLKISL